MTMDILLVLMTYLLVLTLAGALLYFTGRRERVVTPIVLFVGIEVLAVWPALVPLEDGLLATVGAFPAVLAAVGLLAAVVIYVVFGGGRADASIWRNSKRSIPDAETLRSVRVGLVLLVILLVGLGLFTFQGLPPLLTGGFSSLLDPVNNADQATVIRETRKSLTKGQLLGQEYSGNGIINAFTETGWRVAVAVAVLHWTWSRKARSIRLLAVTSLLAFIFLGSAGSRTPLLLCIIAGGAALALRYRLKMRHLAVATALGLGFVLLIMPLSKGATGGTTLTERSAAFVERVSSGNGANNAQIVRLITSGSLDVMNGELFVERFVAMVPGNSPANPFALRVTRLAYGGNDKTTGYSTPTQYGLTYADGGSIGVILGYLFSGALLALAWRAITRVRHPLGAAAATEGAILLGSVSVSGIHGLLSAAPLAALLLLVVSGPRGWSGLAARRRGSATKPKAFADDR